MGKIISICNYHKNKFSNPQDSPSRIGAKKDFLKFVLLTYLKKEKHNLQQIIYLKNNRF